MSDMVAHPSHYAEDRKFEVIDVIEDSVQFAPDAIVGGLQWQVLKYVHRCWGKSSALQDLKKARWYLDRLITKLEKEYGAV
jgi:hypothetical protein